MASPVLEHDLEAAYQRLARDDRREAEALEWSEALMRDGADAAG